MRNKENYSLYYKTFMSIYFYLKDDDIYSEDSFKYVRKYLDCIFGSDNNSLLRFKLFLENYKKEFDISCLISYCAMAISCLSICISLYCIIIDATIYKILLFFVFIPIVIFIILRNPLICWKQFSFKLNVISIIIFNIENVLKEH